MSTGAKKCIVYALVSATKPKRIRYIGQTTAPLEKRLKQHIIHSSHCMKKTPVGKWVRSMIFRGLKINIIALNNRAIWNKTEIRLIQHHRKLGVLLNVTEGGRGHYGAPLPPTVRKKISRALMGRKKTKAHAAAISAGKKGKRPSASHLKNMSLCKIGVPVYALRGRTLSIEHRIKTAIAKGQKPFLIISKKTGRIIGEWQNANQCARDLSITPTCIRNVLNKWSKSTRDYLVEYKR